MGSWADSSARATIHRVGAAGATSRPEARAVRTGTRPAAPAPARHPDLGEPVPGQLVETRQWPSSGRHPDRPPSARRTGSPCCRLRAGGAPRRNRSPRTPERTRRAWSRSGSRKNPFFRAAESGTHRTRHATPQDALHSIVVLATVAGTARRATEGRQSSPVVDEALSQVQCEVGIRIGGSLPIRTATS